MIFVEGYFDESLPGQQVNDESVPEFVVVAGFVNLTENWLPFCIDWGKVLDLPKPIQYFHGVEANGRREQFAGFSKEERDEKVIALIDTIREHRPQPLISAVYPADYGKLWGEFPGVMPPDPYIFCLYHLLIEAADLNRSRKTIEPFKISLIFENNEAMRKKAGETFDYVLKQKPELAHIFDGLAFADKQLYKPLQAADALAYDLNKEFTRQLRSPGSKMRKSLEAILESAPGRGVYWPWRYEDLRKVFEGRYRRLVEGKNDEGEK